MGETEPKKHFMGLVRAVPSPPVSPGIAESGFQSRQSSGLDFFKLSVRNWISRVFYCDDLIIQYYFIITRFWNMRFILSSFYVVSPFCFFFVCRTGEAALGYGEVAEECLRRYWPKRAYVGRCGNNFTIFPPLPLPPPPQLAPQNDSNSIK